VQKQASLWLRIRVWFRWPVLAEELALGRNPAASPELTVLANQMVGRRAQHRLADTLERVMAAASGRPSPGSAKALNRREILGAGDELSALAARLRDGGPAPLPGLAYATLLVHDGASPLYGPRATRDVWSFAREARRRLDA
jgi:hypothetical protein